MLQGAFPGWSGVAAAFRSDCGIKPSERPGLPIGDASYHDPQGGMGPGEPKLHDPKVFPDSAGPAPGVP